VDTHCHLAGLGAGGSGCFVSPRLRHNWRFNIYTDVSARTQINKPGVLREALTRPELNGRLLYGTDYSF